MLICFIWFESEKVEDLIDTLKRKNIQSVFHYSSLHLSHFYKLINKKNKVLKIQICIQIVY